MLEQFEAEDPDVHFLALPLVATPSSEADLQLLFARLNQQHFRGALRSYRIAWNPRLTTIAGRVGHRPPVIELSRALLASHPDQVEPTLLHEMIHAWLHAMGLPAGHGADFKRKMRAVGLTSIYHHMPVPRRRFVAKYALTCPRCGVVLIRRRRPGYRVSCARCEPLRYDPRYEMRVTKL